MAIPGMKEIFTEAPGTGVMIELKSMDDILCLAFIQEWEERTYFEMFCKELESCGITYSLKSEGPLILTKMADL